MQLQVIMLGLQGYAEQDTFDHQERVVQLENILTTIMSTKYYQSTKQKENKMKTQLDDYSDDEIKTIAKLCHAINKVYCHAIGDNSQVDWNEAPEWQQQSAIKGVEFIIQNPDVGPSASHDSWLKEKEATGWKYGPIKDVDKKEHPCFVPYEQLPLNQQIKDHIFRGQVLACIQLINEDN
jgi:hypothetical protein